MALLAGIYKRETVVNNCSSVAYQTSIRIFYEEIKKEFFQ